MTSFTNDFSKEIWENTYKYHTDTTIDGTFNRVATALASVETLDCEDSHDYIQSHQKMWADRFYDLLTDFKVTLGGRIYANAGTEYSGTTLINCFVGPRDGEDLDSLDGILKTLREQVHTLRSEGGWGMNFSFIRPRSAFVKGIGVESPGSIEYIGLFNYSSKVITAGSGKKSLKKEAKGKIRKGAMMAIVDCWHPDVEEFITAKQKSGVLDKFNISVNCSNEFMDRLIKINKKLEKNEDVTELDKWDLVFPDTTFEYYKKEWDGNINKWKEKKYPIIVYKTIKLTYLWNLIMESTYKRNDPGIFFGDRANYTHCWNYGAYIGATNPCGEQALPYGSTCNLLSLNLTQFLNADSTDFDYEKLKKYIPIAVRLADNVNDYSNAPLPQYIESLRNRRRIGLGILGWGSALYLLKIRFGSPKAEKLKIKLMECMTHTAIRASINLAKEKGCFKDCDKEKHANHPYFKQIGLPQKDIDDIRKYGIRNSATFSFQPTGNTSVFANLVSGGMEPIPWDEFIRTVIISECPDFLKNIVPKYWEGDYKENKYFKSYKEGTDDILKYVCPSNGITYKIDSNRGLTKEVLCEDYAVKILKEKGEWDKEAEWAVTISNLTVDDHIKDMTGFGKWIDSSMSKTVNLPNDYSYEDFKTLYIKAYQSGVLKGITTYRTGTMMSVLSTVEDQNKIHYNDSPKRPDSLVCDVFHITRGGQPYFILVGKMPDGSIYEVFAGKNNNDAVNKNVKHGIIIKRGRGKYKAEFDDDTELSPLKAFIDPTEESFTRLISSTLRHGMRVQHLVEQLEKDKGDLNSLAKVVVRALKNYLEEGSKVGGASCPDCGGELRRSEGCANCPNCGYSKC